MPILCPDDVEGTMQYEVAVPQKSNLIKCLWLLLASCSQENPIPSGSNLKVTDGVEISATEFPSVVRLDLGDAICTGTFVSPTTLITAAHCLENRPTIQYNRILAVKVIQNARYFRQNINDDIGVVVFPENTAPAQTGFLGRSPRSGEAVTIVGYGNSYYPSPFSETGSGSGTRRKGQNVVRSLEEGLILVEARNSRPDRAICGSGDSGGPLFVDNKLAGVTSSRSVSLNPPICFYVDLEAPNTRDFLNRAVKEGADIPALTSTNKPLPPPQPSNPPAPLPPQAPQNPNPFPNEINQNPNRFVVSAWPVGPGVVRQGCYCTSDASGNFCAVYKNQNSRAWTRKEGGDCQLDCTTYLKQDLSQCATEP